MANEILYTGNLQTFIESLDIPKEKKEALIARLPNMDLDDRKALFKKLLMVYFLDQEDNETEKEIKELYN
jgi:hypothetical protein